MSKILEFHLKDQILSGGFPVVSDSRNIVSARFVLDIEPTGSVTAIFCGPTNKPYCVLLDESRICKIPWEVLVLPQKTATSYFSVSLVIGERLTTSCAIVPLIPSGYAEGETPEPPTPSVYEKILEEYKRMASAVVVKTYSMYCPDDQTSYHINLVKDENKYYSVLAVTVNIAGGDMLLCDVSVYDYEAGGSSGVCNVTVTLAELVGEAIVIRILYTEV